MKKLFLSLIILLSCTAYAQKWDTTTVYSKDRSIAGYISHTTAIGTQRSTKPEKVVAGLRVVCSAKGNSDPLVIVFWDTMTGTGPVSIKMKIDNKDFDIAGQNLWMQEDAILVRTLAESIPLIQALRSGKNLYLNWIDSRAVERSVIFDISGMSAQLVNFNAVCNTHI